MREFISVDREVNKVRLLRSTFKGTFLLVEGHTDQIFYNRLIDKSVCQSLIIVGKPSNKQCVIAVLQQLENSDFPGVLAIVDADFDHLVNDLPNYSSNLLRTDTHDLETMLLNSLAFDKVLDEFGSESKISSFDGDIREVLLAAGKPVGYLRWISQTEELNLTFNGIDFSKFVDKNQIKISYDKLIDVVKNKSQKSYLSTPEIISKITNLNSQSYDPWQICCGHDLVEILSLALCKAIGSHNSQDVKPDIIDRSLRLAYEKAYFYQTHLYSEICLWESHNQPLRIL
ncbi:MAG: DUF4435 domain-containing protein [Arthrospira sp. SH-MAG29]|nr:DUF4435 domain-containing protein [Arthrospira sp. SH-MAG29]MBS0018610.1 DUF4435 domain-containing protein [Arthrospira sp. SH-MAG29]